jgi:hypothetical protein
VYANLLTALSPHRHRTIIASTVSALGGAAAGAAAYLNLIDLALEDRILSLEEWDVLQATALEWGLSRRHYRGLGPDQTQTRRGRVRLQS